MIVSNSLSTSKIKQTDKTSRIAGCDHQLCSSIQMHHIFFQCRQNQKELSHVITSYATASRRITLIQKWQDIKNCRMWSSAMQLHPDAPRLFPNYRQDQKELPHVTTSYATASRRVTLIQKARHQELSWDHQLCNNIQVHPSAGTHQSVLRCFPCYIPASLDQVGYNRPDPPAVSRSFTSFQMVHTHRHARLEIFILHMCLWIYGFTIP